MINNTNPRMLPRESNADYCRRMGYVVGTRLIGDEGYGPTVIEITAIGKLAILAETVSDVGNRMIYRGEMLWPLDCRAWTKIADAPAYYGA